MRSYILLKILVIYSNISTISIYDVGKIAINKHNKTNSKKPFFCLWLFFLNGKSNIKTEDTFKQSTNGAI